MTTIVRDPTVEDILECVLAEEEVAQNPHFPAVFAVSPEISQIGDSVDELLARFEFLEQIIIASS